MYKQYEEYAKKAPYENTTKTQKLRTKGEFLLY